MHGALPPAQILRPAYLYRAVQGAATALLTYIRPTAAMYIRATVTWAPLHAAHPHSSHHGRHRHRSLFCGTPCNCPPGQLSRELLTCVYQPRGNATTMSMGMSTLPAETTPKRDEKPGVIPPSIISIYATMSHFKRLPHLTGAPSASPTSLTDSHEVPGFSVSCRRLMGSSVSTRAVHASAG